MATRAALKRRTGHIFYTGASLAIVIVVFVGFAPTYYLKGYFQTAPLPLVNHLHGVVFTGWIVLFAAQVRLVAVHRVDLHRRLGVAGAWLAGAVVTLGVTAALLSGRHNFAAGNDGALAFLVIPFGDMLTFCVLTTAGLYYRRRPDVHRRLMLLATVTLLGAAWRSP